MKVIIAIIYYLKQQGGTISIDFYLRLYWQDSRLAMPLFWQTQSKQVRKDGVTTAATTTIATTDTSHHSNNNNHNCNSHAIKTKIATAISISNNNTNKNKL